MNAKDFKNLEEAARQWIISHEDEIEVSEVYIRKDEELLYQATRNEELLYNGFLETRHEEDLLYQAS